MPFPLEPEGARRFAEGLDTIVVVEEKRALIETQLKDVLYAAPDAPRIAGKRDEDGRPLFPSAGRLDTNHIAVEIGRRLLARVGDSDAAGASVPAWNKPVSRPPAALDGAPAGWRSITGASWTRCSGRSARPPASSSTTRPARRRSAAGASAGSSPIRPGARSSTPRYARDAGTAA